MPSLYVLFAALPWAAICQDCDLVGECDVSGQSVNFLQTGMMHKEQEPHHVDWSYLKTKVGEGLNELKYKLQPHHDDWIDLKTKAADIVNMSCGSRPLAPRSEDDLDIQIRTWLLQNAAWFTNTTESAEVRRLAAHEIMSKLMTPWAPRFLVDVSFDNFNGRNISEAEYLMAKHDMGIFHEPGPVPLVNFSTGWLNRSLLTNNTVVHIQTSNLRLFTERVLPHVQARIVVVLGEWQLAETQKVLPPLSNVNDLRVLLSSPWVIHVFMQNPELTNWAHPDFSAIPYGLKPSADLLDIVRQMAQSYKQNWLKERTLFVPPAGMTLHRIWRPEGWPGVGDQDMQLKPYYQNIASALFITSPGGDRPDTYRHAEAILLNALPVTNLPRSRYCRLYGDNMIYLDACHGLSDARISECYKIEANQTMTSLKTCSEAVSKYHWPRRELLLVAFWRKQIQAARRKQKGQELSPASSDMGKDLCL